jgi:hypothetical protein
MTGVQKNEMTPHHPKVAVTTVIPQKCRLTHDRHICPFTDECRRAMRTPMFWWSSTYRVSPSAPQLWQPEAGPAVIAPRDRRVGKA